MTKETNFMAKAPQLFDHFSRFVLGVFDLGFIQAFDYSTFRFLAFRDRTLI